MPKQYYIKELHQTVVVADNPFASGGEGELYDILSPSHLTHCVAKIFHPKKRDAQKESKINYLIQNPPIFEESPTESPIIWAKHLLHSQGGEFMGFVMPKATGEKLEILTSPKLPKYLGKEWNRFRLGGDDALRYRLKVCYNIAAALRAIHATGKYVLVDLKPDNIIIKSNGVVSIVDTDSIEVIEDGKTIYPATVATPEYTPSEYYDGVKPGVAVINTSWDSFSMAVIFYRMLFGVHPYAATSVAPYDNVNALGDKIKHGLFVHNHDIADKFTVVPPPHRKFGKLDANLRKLFSKTFVDGHSNPDARPTAEDWGQALLNNPLLLTNRPLPSKALNLEAINEKNWYVMALEKSMMEQNLLWSGKEVKTNMALPAHTSNDVMQEALGYYKQAGGFLKRIAKFGGIVFGVSMALFVLATVLSGSPMGDFSYAIDSLWMLITFIPSLIFEMGGFGLFFLILWLPFIIATFRQFTGIAKDKTQTVRKNLIGTFAVTDGQKKKSLEELQYTLFNQRSKVKQRLREIQNELIVWNRVKIDKEKEFINKNNHKISESNQEISTQLNSEKMAIQHQDEAAKQLMLEEADQIKKLRLDLQTKLNENPYSKLQGKTTQQKIAYLDEPSNNNLDVVEISQLKAALLELEDNLNRDLKSVKEEFDKKHAELQGNTQEYKIKIDSLVNESVDTMRKKIRIDSSLMDDSFKRLLKSIKNLQIEIDSKESELEVINEDIKQLKDELKVLK